MSILLESIIYLSACVLTAPPVLMVPDNLKPLETNALMALYEKSLQAREPDYCNKLSPILEELVSRPDAKGPFR
jgi:hypothetical protein